MEYQDHEFCNDIMCEAISSKNKCICEEIYWKDCIHTAKEFHKWLKENGYMIIRTDHPASAGGGEACIKIQNG